MIRLIFGWRKERFPNKINKGSDRALFSKVNMRKEVVKDRWKLSFEILASRFAMSVIKLAISVLRFATSVLISVRKLAISNLILEVSSMTIFPNLSSTAWIRICLWSSAKLFSRSMNSLEASGPRTDSSLCGIFWTIAMRLGYAG